MRHITERAQAPNPNAGLSSEPFLAGAARVEVVGYPDRPPFSVLARTPGIQKYPCATCHTVPLAEMHGGAPRKRAHWDVTLQHAPAAVMACATCHAAAELDDARGRCRARRWRSTTATRSARSATPARPRTGRAGAHGKRVGGWAPPRVVAGLPRLPRSPPACVGDALARRRRRRRALRSGTMEGQPSVPIEADTLPVLPSRGTAMRVRERLRVRQRRLRARIRSRAWSASSG